MKQFLSLFLVTAAVILSSCTPNSKGAYKYAAIIGVDGAGAWFTEEIAPSSYAIGQDGASGYDVQSCTPTISAQCWGTMLLGVQPEVHKLTNDYITENPTDPDGEFPSLFKLIKKADPEAKLASFSAWTPINIGIIEDHIGVVKGTAAFPEIEDKEVRYPKVDASVTEQAVNYLAENVPSLLFVHLNNVDAAGHFHDYTSPEHFKAITLADSMIKQIYDAYERQGVLDETLFIIVADHGGLEQRHGGDSPDEKNVFLGIHGRTIVPGSRIVDAELQDIPMIIAYALGIDIPENWTGKIPSGVFPEIK